MSRVKDPNYNLWDEMNKMERNSDRIQLLLEALDKIRDPRKRDHYEPDNYTALACVMNIAELAILEDERLRSQ